MVPNQQTVILSMHGAEMPSQVTQTDGLRRPIAVTGILQKVLTTVQVSFPWLQCRLLMWDQHNHQKVIEVTRLKSDISPDKGGPSTVAKVLFFNDGLCTLKVQGKEDKSGRFSDDLLLIDHVRISEYLQHLRDNFVFCTGLPQNIFSTALTGIRYEPQCLVKKTSPFEHVWTQVNFVFTQLINTHEYAHTCAQCYHQVVGCKGNV